MRGKIIHRMGRHPHFSYYSSSGDPVSSSSVTNYIQSLAIPPAWKDVEISDNPSSKILATGIDKAGRKQYLYNPDFRRMMDHKKYDRLLGFASKLPTMRKVTAEHLKRHDLDELKVLACMLRLIDLAYFRVGNEKYAEENNTYGLTTMRSKHLTINGDHLEFDFIGKSHMEHHQEIVDRKLAKVIAELGELPGYEIFKFYDGAKLRPVTSEMLNAYIHKIMGDNYSAKDFRTWAGTLIAAVELALVGPAATPTGTKKQLAATVKIVSEKLGNTPAIARASYIDPRVIEQYKKGHTIDLKRPASVDDPELLAAEEHSVIQFLKQSPYPIL